MDFELIVFYVLLFGFPLGVGFIANYLKNRPDTRPLEQQREAFRVEEARNKNLWWGYLTPNIVCPHCQEKGHVRTKSVKKKAGISGAKATAAVLTAGVSLLGTGLARKEELTEAYCENCGSTWHF